MKKIQLKPIATVRNSRTLVRDDNWGDVISEIILEPSISEEAFTGIEEFSHLEIIFYFHKVADEKAVATIRHPRNNKSLPLVGTFAQRNKNRPNKIGLTVVNLIKREGNKLIVRYLDAIDGTPVLDIKPVVRTFSAKGEIRQPQWSIGLVDSYW